MQANPTVVLVLAFVGTFFAIGIRYWQIPYTKASLPNSLYGIGIIIPFLVSAVVRLVSRASFKQSFAIIGLAVPACVMARVGFDTLRDPTSHNLWPIEIVIAAGVGFAATLAGALLGGLLASVLKICPAKNVSSYPNSVPTFAQGAERIATNWHSWLNHRAVRVAVGIAGLGLSLNGAAAVLAGEGRGGAAAMVLGVVAVYWAAVGRMPLWFRR